jgi:hypothetical protein
VIVTDCLDARLFVAVEPTGRVGRDVGVVFHRSPKLRRRRFPLHLATRVTAQTLRLSGVASLE